jgi:co-chaperonin GroES (HSP10)
MQVKPQGARLLVELEGDGESTTTSGIIIAATAEQDLPKVGKIVAIGEIEGDYELGGIILISKFAGEPSPDGNTIIDENDILAKIE